MTHSAPHDTRPEVGDAVHPPRVDLRELELLDGRALLQRGRRRQQLATLRSAQHGVGLAAGDLVPDPPPLDLRARPLLVQELLQPREHAAMAASHRLKAILERKKRASAVSACCCGSASEVEERAVAVV